MWTEINKLTAGLCGLLRLCQQADGIIISLAGPLAGWLAEAKGDLLGDESHSGQASGMHTTSLTSSKGRPTVASV